MRDGESVSQVCRADDGEEGVGREGAEGEEVIDKPFAYHKPSDDWMVRITAVREAYSALKAALETHCPPSRHLSVSLTELETSAMWAIKAVVFNDPASEVS